MELTVISFIYLDYLLDPAFKKSFSENSTRDEIENRLQGYFDKALDRKGFDYQRFEQNSPVNIEDRRPHRYEQERRKIVRNLAGSLFQSNVFRIVNHPLFGISCDVDAEKFVEVCDAMRGGLRIEGSPLSLEDDIAHYGLRKFQSILPRVYGALSGFYKPESWEDSGSLIGSADGSVDLPIADEVISIDADAPEIIEMKRLGAELIDQLQSANDLGDLSREEASAAAGEVRQIITALNNSRIRKRQVFEFAKSSLRWIASKGGEALIGTLATALLGAIALYFGFPL